MEQIPMQNFPHQPNDGIVVHHNGDMQLHQRSTFFRKPVFLTACAALLLLIVGGSVFVLFQGMQSSKHPGVVVPSHPSVTVATPITHPTSTTQPTTTQSSNSGIYVAMQSYLYKLDKTGKTKLWEHQIKGLGNLIAAANNVVYAYSTSSELNHLSYVYAFRTTDGHALWKVQMTPSEVHDLSNLAVDNQNLYVFSVDGTIHALDATNGKQRWVYHTNDVYFNIPVRINSVNDILYISAKYRFYALSTANGHLLWMKSVGINNGVFAAPLIANGVVYVALSKEKVPAENPSVSTMYAWTTGGNLLWHSQQINDFIPNAPAIGDNQLYVVGETKVYALNGANGKLSWQQFVGETSLYSPLLDHNDTLYLSLEGPYQWIPGSGPTDNVTNIIALKAHDGSLIWQKRYTWIAPFVQVIINGILYIELQDYKGNGHVYAVSTANHATLWSYNHPLSNPTQSQGEGNSLVVIP